MHEALTGLITALAFIIIAHATILRPVYLSPLAKIPHAHWSTSFSSIWILIARKSNRENSLLHEAHQTHGPVVRIGPNDVSIDGVDAIRIVYQGGFEKDPWYSVFDNYGARCMFSARNSQDHSARKRMLSNVYSKSFIQSSKAAKSQAQVILLERLLPMICDSCSPFSDSSGINVHSLFLATTMDFIAAYVFGLCNATNFIQNTAYREHWLRLYNSRNDHHFWPQEMPTLTTLLKKLGVWLYPRWVDDANAELGDWNLELCNKAFESITQPGSNTVDTADEPVVLNTLNAGIDREIRTKGQDSILYSSVIQNRDLSVASELFDHVLAGQETAGIALTYLSWHLSKNPDLQCRVREELLTLSNRLTTDDPNHDYELPDARELDALPLLHSVVMETLRLHAPIPGPQARRTPYPSCFINGFEISGGVRIAGLAHTLHRNETVFPQPDLWDHRRWLASESTNEQLQERHRQFWAFGSGGRMCIGSNFAMNEMKYIVAAIYTNFTSRIVDDRGMEQTDGYTSRPASDRLMLRFESLGSYKEI